MMTRRQNPKGSRLLRWPNLLSTPGTPGNWTEGTRRRRRHLVLSVDEIADRQSCEFFTSPRTSVSAWF